MKKQPVERENILANHIPYTVSISKVDEELMQLTSKKSNNPKMGKRLE